MKTKTIIIMGVFILAVVGVFLGLNSMSIIDDGELSAGDKIDLQYQCSIPQDCIDSAIENNNLYPESVADFKENIDLKCESQHCWGYVK